MDPISAKLTSSALQNIGQQQVTHAEPNFQTDKSNFAEMLDNQFTQENSQLGNDQLFEMVNSMIQDPSAPQYNAISGQEVQMDVARAGEVEGGSAFKTNNLFESFKNLNNEQLGLERVMETLQSGKKFTAAELFRIQTLTQTYNIHLEIGNKFAEGITSGFKKVWETQVS